MYSSASVTAADLADLLGLSERRINDLVRAGTVIRASDGGYDVRESVRNYCLAQRARTKSSGLTAARQKLVEEQANRESMRNQRERGLMVPVVDVEAVWARTFTELRQGLLAVPGRLAGLAPVQVAAIDREIREALTVLGENEL